MAATLVFGMDDVDPRVTNFNVYRKRGSAAFARIAQIPVQLQYTDPDAMVGDFFAYTFFDNVRFLESGYSPVIILHDSYNSVTVTGFAVGIDGKPAGEDVVVDIRLQNLSLKAAISDGQLITSLAQTVITDEDGMFIFDVIPNDLIFPSKTYYRVEYLEKRYFKEVKSTGGSGQLFTTLLDVQPKELR